ncbi:hypothetical protein RYX56_20720 [Alkalihalophilus lindianensis]|uniref:Uncharacterized protein n=1 Tax=Alkalihalophilus lindianensis TaxID=1630542 RepID=A0ABU3XFV6_9BACI|nr:hypothetical protein [Alkalihalophilus lindianensis]MDV2686787.1 hypothetical protein [Alkalihalophilus lindianensis]
MSSSKRNKKFEIGFHIIIFVFAIGVIVSTIIGASELDRATLYLTLGIVIGIGSLYQIYKIIKSRKESLNI